MEKISSFTNAANVSLDLIKSKGKKARGTGIGAGMALKSTTEFITHESGRLEAKRGHREVRRNEMIKVTKNIKKDTELSLEEKESELESVLLDYTLSSLDDNQSE